MLYRGSPYAETNDEDVEVLIAMANHGMRNKGEPGWHLIVLLEVMGKPMVGKIQPGMGVEKLSVDVAMENLGKVVGKSVDAAMEKGATLNPAMEKYAVGMGVMYLASLVPQDAPQADVLAEEAEIMGRITVDEAPEGSEMVHHLLVRHMNGLYYSHWLPMQGEWPDDVPTVRVDKPDGEEAVFGVLGEGLEAMVQTLKDKSGRKVEVRG